MESKTRLTDIQLLTVQALGYQLLLIKGGFFSSCLPPPPIKFFYHTLYLPVSSYLPPMNACHFSSLFKWRLLDALF